MPELPEVETVCRGIRPAIIDQTIIEAKLFTKKLRFPLPAKLEQKLKGRKILDVRRKAKYILLDLDDDLILVFHLGMTGRLTVSNKQKPKLKHDHLYILLNKKLLITFNDTRKFGLIDLIEKANLDQHKLFSKLGWEPFSDEFNAENFYNSIKKRKKSIKVTIMDAGIIVGVGNIYASEALFLAGIDPERLANTLTKKEAEKLRVAIVETLARAIAAGGSSLKDYVNAAGDSGYFQHQFLVYDRADQPCKTCSKPIIRLKQAGRSTYKCSKCQR